MLPALSLSLLLGACSGNEVPDGYERYEGDGYTFVYPGSWEEDPNANANTDAEVMFVGAEEEDGTSPTVRAGTQTGVDDLEAAVLAADATSRTFLDNFEEVSREEIEVSGADEALRIESRYTADLETGGTVEITRHTIAALNDGTLYFIWFTAKDETMSTLQEELETVLSSFSVS